MACHFEESFADDGASDVEGTEILVDHDDEGHTETQTIPGDGDEF